MHRNKGAQLPVEDTEAVHVLTDSLRRATGVRELAPQDLYVVFLAQMQQLARHVQLANIKQRSPAAKIFPTIGNMKVS